MPIPTWSQTIDTLFTSTWAYRRREATEQAFLKTPFIYWLRQRGRSENLSGYRRIEIPLEYGSNETLRWIGKGSTVPIQDSELLTMAYDDWKYAAVSIVRWFTEDQQNRGQAAAIRLVETKLNAAERALTEELERVVFADGTGDKEPNGLQNLVSTTPTSGIVHGLDRAIYPWWQNQAKAASGAAAVYLVSDMRTCLNDVTKYSRSEIRDIILVTDQSTYELYEDVCLEMKILSNTMLADAGFENIQFKGKPLIWSPSAPSGRMYFINPSYMKLVYDESFFMEMTDWKQIPDQPFDKVAQIVCALNLVVSRAVCHKVLYNISA
ncbi:MAG: phage major capsid protein [Thermoleophilum sp.]|nr:phage major capsid protein [Thermoleophilum sp.]